MTDFQKRARNALLGLAIGDAIGWPAMFHRSRLLPPWTRRIRREIDAQREESGVLRVPMPFSLNQAPETFGLCPTDDTEWAAWTMRNLLRHRCEVRADWVWEAWLALADGKETVRGGVSTQVALENLRKGILPPASGRDNPHYFDDGAASRAVPIGIACSPDSALASRGAEIDACVTNSEDGVWIACAVAAAVSAACAGQPARCVVDAARETLPADSWSWRVVEEALAIAAKDVPLLAIVPSLHGLLNAEYSDGCAGPETLALSLAIVSRLGERFEEAVTVAASFAKGADAVPAIVGAISGALSPAVGLPDAWPAPWTLRGISLPSLAGEDFPRLADEFVVACSSSRNSEAQQ